ncbi:DUF417 family protein [Caballeronia sp.]|uniref:DUF417 family protein n=1 Tax=Caballeronia sp. TaxID=1931223 RepID=UPI003C4F2FDD
MSSLGSAPLKPWFPKASVLGGILATIFFVGTLSFMVTTPGIGEASAGGFPVLSATGEFLMKDIALFGFSTVVAGRRDRHSPQVGASCCRNHLPLARTTMPGRCDSFVVLGRDGGRGFDERPVVSFTLGQLV